MSTPNLASVPHPLNGQYSFSFMSTSRTNQIEPTQHELEVLGSPDKVTHNEGSRNEVEGLTTPEKAAPGEGSLLEVEVPNNMEEAITDKGSQPEVHTPCKATTDEQLGQQKEVNK